MSTRRRVINLTVILAIILVATYVIGCKGSAGIRNGAIRGRCLQISGQPIPQGVKVRAEGVNDPVSRYSLTDTGGEFYIPDVPVNTYEMYFIVDGYQLAMDEIGGGTIGTAVTGVQYWVPSGLKAFVESGRTYELPNAYFKKIPMFQAITVWGYVKNYYTNGSIVGAAVTIGNGSAVSGTDGRYEVAGIYAGLRKVTCTMYGYNDYKGSEGTDVLINVGDAGDNMMQYDVRLRPEPATIRGSILEKTYQGILTASKEEEMGWDLIQLTVRDVPILKINGVVNGKIDGPQYTLEIPSGHSNYVITATHPYCVVNPGDLSNTITVSATGGLQAGQEATADPLYLTWKEATGVDIKVVTPGENQSAGDKSLVMIDFANPSSDEVTWSGTTETSDPVEFTAIPIGIRKFSTASSGLSSVTDIQDEKIRVTEQTRAITLPLD